MSIYLIISYQSSIIEDIEEEGIIHNFDSFYDCYKRNNKSYNWLSFFDFDEYLELKNKNQNIQEFLGNKRYQKCINIKINWLIYSDNNLIYYENKLLKDRFLKPSINNSLNRIIKSTVRGNLKVNYWQNLNNPHSSFNNFTACSSSGKVTDSNNYYVTPPDYEYAILKHYFTKTIEEYCNKIKRGRSDAQIIFNNYALINVLNKYFFKINEKTKNKLYYLKKNFNISFD